jgi:hypothetical protein
MMRDKKAQHLQSKEYELQVAIDEINHGGQNTSKQMAMKEPIMKKMEMYLKFINNRLHRHAEMTTNGQPLPQSNEIIFMNATQDAFPLNEVRLNNSNSISLSSRPSQWKSNDKMK